MNNKKIGNDFESEFCDILFKNGFWSHNMAQNASGQPADVIAVRNGQAYLIDCKVCERKVFRLSRIEENQEQSMTLWKSLGNNEGLFAIKFGEKIYMVFLSTLLEARREEIKTFTENQIQRIGFSLADWLKEA